MTYLKKKVAAMLSKISKLISQLRLISIYLTLDIKFILKKIYDNYPLFFKFMFMRAISIIEFIVLINNNVAHIVIEVATLSNVKLLLKTLLLMSMSIFKMLMRLLLSLLKNYYLIILLALLILFAHWYFIVIVDVGAKHWLIVLSVACYKWLVLAFVLYIQRLLVFIFLILSYPFLIIFYFMGFLSYIFVVITVLRDGLSVVSVALFTIWPYSPLDVLIFLQSLIVDTCLINIDFVWVIFKVLLTLDYNLLQFLSFLPQLFCSICDMLIWVNDLTAIIMNFSLEFFIWIFFKLILVVTLPVVFFITVVVLALLIYLTYPFLCMFAVIALIVAIISYIL